MSHSPETVLDRKGVSKDGQNGIRKTSVNVLHKSFVVYKPETTQELNGHRNGHKPKERKSFFRKAKETANTIRETVIFGKWAIEKAAKVRKHIAENQPYIQELREARHAIDEAENNPFVGEVVLSKQDLVKHGLALYSFGASMQKLNENAAQRQWFGLRYKDEKWTHEGAVPDLIAQTFKKAGFEVDSHYLANEGDPTWRTKEVLKTQKENIINDSHVVIMLDFWNFNGARRAVNNPLQLAANVYVPHVANPKEFVTQAKGFIAEYTQDRLEGLEIEQEIYEKRAQDGKKTIIIEQTQPHFEMQRKWMPLFTVGQKSEEDKFAGFAPNTRGLRLIGESVMAGEAMGQKVAHEVFIAKHLDSRIPIIVVPGNKIGRVEGKTKNERKKSRNEALKRRDGTYHLGPLGQQEYAQAIAEKIMIWDEESGEKESLADIAGHKTEHNSTREGN